MSIKTMNRENLMAALIDKYPALKVRTSEEFDGEKTGIWIYADPTLITVNNDIIFSYNSTNQKQRKNGVIKPLDVLVEKNGWYFQWHDPETLMAWEK